MKFGFLKPHFKKVLLFEIISVKIKPPTLVWRIEVSFIQTKQPGSPPQGEASHGSWTQQLTSIYALQSPRRGPGWRACRPGTDFFTHCLLCSEPMRHGFFGISSELHLPLFGENPRTLISLQVDKPDCWTARLSLVVPMVLGSGARTRVLAHHLRGSLIYQEALVSFKQGS